MTRQIDLEPRKHSHSFELKPWSRWWLLFPLGGIALTTFANGWDDPVTWSLVFCGALLMAFLVLVFPHYWLSRRD